MDEEIRDGVLVAVHQDLGQVLVGVDAGREDDLDAGLVRDPLREAGIPATRHGVRIDDGLHPVQHDRAGVGQGLVELVLLVVEVRPLERGPLVPEAEMLVDQGRTEILHVDRTGHALDGCHRTPPRSLPAAGTLSVDPCGPATI